MLLAVHWHESAMGVHVFPLLNPPSPYPIPQGHPSAPTPSTLSHASNLNWWFVSHMIIYTFQCYSLKPSHSCLEGVIWLNNSLLLAVLSVAECLAVPLASTHWMPVALPPPSLGDQKCLHTSPALGVWGTEKGRGCKNHSVEKHCFPMQRPGYVSNHKETKHINSFNFLSRQAFLFHINIEEKCQNCKW